MTRVAVPAGVGLPGRVLRPGHDQWLPKTSACGLTNTSTSTHYEATCIAHGSTAHTKGAWVEVVAATTAPISMLSVMLSTLTGAGGTDTSSLLDLGVGGAGSETVVVADLPVGYATGLNTYDLPISFPAGSRIAVRCQSAVLSKNVTVRLFGNDAPATIVPRSTLVNIGANSATSRGVDLTQPASTNTKSAWTEITSSCPQALQALVVGIQGAGDPSIGGVNLLLDVGVGAAGSEVVAIHDLQYLGNSAEHWGMQCPTTTYAVRVPRGARIAARIAMSAGVNNGVDVILLGVPA